MNYFEIVQHVIAVLIVGATAYMAVASKTPPDWLLSAFWIVVGMYLKPAIRQASNSVGTALHRLRSR